MLHVRAGVCVGRRSKTFGSRRSPRYGSGPRPLQIRRNVHGVHEALETSLPLRQSCPRGTLAGSRICDAAGVNGARAWPCARSLASLLDACQHGVASMWRPATSIIHISGSRVFGRVLSAAPGFHGEVPSSPSPEATAASCRGGSAPSSCLGAVDKLCALPEGLLAPARHGISAGEFTRQLRTMSFACPPSATSHISKAAHSSAAPSPHAASFLAQLARCDTHGTARAPAEATVAAAALVPGCGVPRRSPLSAGMLLSSSSFTGPVSSAIQAMVSDEPAVAAPEEHEATSLVDSLQEALGTPFSSDPSLAPHEGLVVVISGPSGVGKDAVIRRLQEVCPDLHFVVTATSRKMRDGEVHGKDYFFVSREEFETMIAEGELLEHALVYGEYKGIPKQQVREAVKKQTDVVLRLDVQGAATLRGLLGGAGVFIFLTAENELALVKRLIGRKTEPLDRLVVRVATARQEMERVNEFDYVVVNEGGCLDRTVHTLRSIIEAEKARVHRTPSKL